MSHTSAFTFLNNENQPQTLHVMGHRMLVRLCVDDKSRMLIDAPVTFDGRKQLPAHLRHEVDLLLSGHKENTNCAEVLAVGPLCRCTRSKTEFKKLNPRRPDGRPIYSKPVPWCMVNPSRPGDFVYLPEQSERGLMWNDALGIGDYTYVLVDECECVAIVPQELAYA